MKKNSSSSTVNMDSYKILIGQNIFDALAKFTASKKYSSVFILTDKIVHKLWIKEILAVLPGANVIIIPPGEKFKNLKTLEVIWKRLFSLGADRHSLLINLGGGVIGDMGGFAAASYMRGIDFVQVPTTLLSQVDASVGGKTAVDLDNAKNIIGSFVRPKLVLIDVNTLSTLPKRELAGGWAEVIKHGLIKDKKYFEEIKKINVAAIAAKPLAEIIKKSCQIKAYFVKADEHEKGPRKILNFGHTIGHAAETLSFKTKRPLLHGEAVALGMVAEAKLSVLSGNLKEKDFEELKKVIKAAGLPIKFPYIKKESILKLIAKDKKNKGKIIKWTLLTKIGAAVYDQECRARDISAAVQEIL